MVSTQALVGIKNLAKHTAKRNLRKVDRLVKHYNSTDSLRKKKLYKDEYYMDKEEYEAFIDKFMELEDDEMPSEVQVKYAEKMWQNKEREANNLKKLELREREITKNDVNDEKTDQIIEELKKLTVKE